MWSCNFLNSLKLLVFCEVQFSDFQAYKIFDINASDENT